MRRYKFVPAFTVATILALSGCAGGSTSEPASRAPSIEAEPATGTTISGDGYSYTVPEGWDVPEGDTSGFGADTIAADLTDTDGFSDNVNVVKSPAGAVTPDQIESAGVTELEGAGATDVQVLDRVTVAGSESAHIGATLSSNGAEYRIDQFYVTDGDQTYVVTFSFSPSVSEQDRAEVAESILATWTFD